MCCTFQVGRTSKVNLVADWAIRDSAHSRDAVSRTTATGVYIGSKKTTKKTQKNNNFRSARMSRGWQTRDVTTRTHSSESAAGFRRSPAPTGPTSRSPVSLSASWLCGVKLHRWTNSNCRWRTSQIHWEVNVAPGTVFHHSEPTLLLVRHTHAHYMDAVLFSRFCLLLPRV